MHQKDAALDDEQPPQAEQYPRKQVSVEPRLADERRQRRRRRHGDDGKASAVSARQTPHQSGQKAAERRVLRALPHGHAHQRHRHQARHQAERPNVLQDNRLCQQRHKQQRAVERPAQRPLLSWVHRRASFRQVIS